MPDSVRPNGLAIPLLLRRVPFHEEHGKLIFHEYFKEPDGTESDWLLFGARGVPVIAFPLTSAGEVIALEHFRYGASEIVLELPGGIIDEGEEPAAAAIRELEEETQFTCDPSCMRPLAPHGVWIDPASVRTQILPYFAANCIPTGRQKQPHVCEHARPVRFGLGEWFRMLASGEIRDSKSYCVSLLALAAAPSEHREQAIAGLVGGGR